VALRRAASLPGIDGASGLPESSWYSVRWRLLGPPLVNEQLRVERLSKPLGLGVLSCDGISSANYGSELILHELLPFFGLGAFTEAPMSTKIAVNLPVKDLAASARFFAALGFPPDNKLATKTMAAFVIGDDIYVLLVDQAQFTATTKKEIPDTAATSEVIVQLQVDGRQRVDELAGNARRPCGTWAPAGHQQNPARARHGRDCPQNGSVAVREIDPEPGPISSREVRVHICRLGAMLGEGWA